MYDITIAASANTEATAQVHQGGAPPLCFVLKKCLITAPINNTSAKITQAKSVAKTIG